MLSVLTFVVFILLAVGSFGVRIKTTETYLGNGMWKVEEYHQYYSQTRTFIGRHDKKGRWHGPVTIEWQGGSKEEVRMSHGRRWGLSTITYPDGSKEENITLMAAAMKIIKLHIALGKFLHPFRSSPENTPGICLH